MMEVFKRSIIVKVVLLFFILLSIWWFGLQLSSLPIDSLHNQLFAAVYGLIGLFGGITGIYTSKQWGGFKSHLGRSIAFFSIGLLFQEIGQIVYSSYIYFLKVEVPYPSIGDIFFYGTIPLYTIAIIYLARVSGVRLSLKSFISKIQALIIPIFILLLSYFVFLQDYEFDLTSPLTVFLDFAVPFGQAIYISLAILTYTLTKRTLGGVMKNKVLLILLALFIQYIADWTFLFQANRDTWYAGGINDYMYLCAYFLMTFSLLELKTIYYKLRSGKE